MNLVYDLRGLRYDTLLNGLTPPRLGVGCGPLAVGVGRLQDRVCPPSGEGLVAVEGDVLQQTIGIQPQLLTTNLNARIQYLFHSRLDRSQKVKRSVWCKACDITLNSELQAKQHYNGKFHQRKLRQQTQPPTEANDSSSSSAYCAKKSGGLKRSSDHLSEDSDGHVAKLVRKENESETTAKEDSNPQHGTTDCATETTKPETVSADDAACQAAEDGDRKDATKMQVLPISDACRKTSDACRKTSEACRIAAEPTRRFRELEISIEVKNSKKVASTNIVPGRISLPVAGLHQYTPLPSPGLPRGVLLAPHPLVTCPSIPFQPLVIPWQGAWVQPTITQPTHGLSFNGATCLSQNSTRCLTSAFVSQRIPSNTAPEVNVTSGLALPLAVLQQTTPTHATALYKSLAVQSDKKIASGQCHDLTSIALSNQNAGLATSSWQRQADLTQLGQPVGVLCSKDLDRLDPVSRAVYSNFLGHFTTRKTRFRSVRHR